MLYEESLLATVTKAQAIREVRAHGIDFEEFLAEVGNKKEYLGKEVLDWLGY